MFVALKINSCKLYALILDSSILNPTFILAEIKSWNYQDNFLWDGLGETRRYEFLIESLCPATVRSENANAGTHNEVVGRYTVFKQFNRARKFITLDMSPWILALMFSDSPKCSTYSWGKVMSLIARKVARPVDLVRLKFCCT